MKKEQNSLIYVLAFFLISTAFQIIYAQPKPVENSSHLQLSLNKLNVLGSVLYVAAHPDDENTALLAYFENNLHLRTAYLSITRGDGGQNLIGTEQGENLGVLRTQELLEARKIDGAKQFFTRAVDFGYSKNAKETLEIWNKNKILSDVVWVIRKFRPDVIITRFPGTGEGGHGNHTASEILADEAFKIAGDSTKFPDQLKYVKPWQPTRIYWNVWPSLLTKRNRDSSKAVKMDIGDYNPLLGESYTEIAAESRSMHKSQGFGVSKHYGRSVNYFYRIDGKPVKNNLFEDIDLSWSRIKGGEKIGEIISSAKKNYDPANPDKIIPTLLNAYQETEKLENSFWKAIKLKELAEVIRSCAGIYIESTTPSFSASPGEKVKINSFIINRSKIPFVLKDVKVTYQEVSKTLNQRLDDNTPYKETNEINIPNDADISQPYWLKSDHDLGNYNIENQQLVGMPENPAALEATYILSVNGQLIKLETPVYYKHTDPVKGEEFRNFVIAPPIFINLQNDVMVFPDNKSKEVSVILKSNNKDVPGNLFLKLEKRWKCEPQSIPFNLKGGDVEKVFTFKISPPKNQNVSNLEAIAQIGKNDFSRGITEIDHPNIQTQVVFPESKAKLIRLDVKKVINKIGYVMGPGDKIPEALKELGYNVTMLTDQDIMNGNLSQYDAIVTGIRVYNTNKEIESESPKLLDYVENGGTLVVQYNKNFGLVTDKIGPYPFHISYDRVTVEEAPVKILDERNSIFNFPNKITQKDFNGWIQERGVYFPDTWDSKYKTPIESNDPGEKPLQGGLLYTKYGKGIFIYTGYAFFRQLPAGVPGAFRLFVNLISAGKAN